MIHFRECKLSWNSTARSQAQAKWRVWGEIQRDPSLGLGMLWVGDLWTNL